MRGSGPGWPGTRTIPRADFSDAGPFLRDGVDLVAYCPAEVANNVGPKMRDLPKTNLNEALALFQQPFPCHHVVSNKTLGVMWRTLIYLVKKRENDRQLFETQPDSLEKTKAWLIAEFDRRQPSVLDAIARSGPRCWSRPASNSLWTRPNFRYSSPTTSTPTCRSGLPANGSLTLV